MIELTPPPHDNPWAEFQRTSFNTKIPPHRIKLHTGATVFPDRETGLIKVRDEEDAQALEAMGWGRDKVSAHFKAVGDDLLRKAYTGQIVRETGTTAMPSTTGRVPSDSELLTRGLARQLDRIPNSAGSAHTRTEFGSVGSLTHGIILVSHERDADGGRLNIHGHSIRMSEIDLDLREALYSTAEAFNRAETQLEQADQVRIVGLLVTEAMRRDARLSDKIREIKMHERYD